jgi:hypothetical protein
LLRRSNLHKPISALQDDGLAFCQPCYPADSFCEPWRDNNRFRAKFSSQPPKRLCLMPATESQNLETVGMKSNNIQGARPD